MYMHLLDQIIPAVLEHLREDQHVTLSQKDFQICFCVLNAN